MEKRDWFETLGVCIEHGTRLGTFAVGQGSLVLTDHGAFQARLRERWEIQWKQHLVKDMMAPWLRVCRDRAEFLELLPIELRANASCTPSGGGGGGAFWVLDSQTCIDQRKGSENIIITAHAHRHDIHSIYLWGRGAGRVVELVTSDYVNSVSALDGAIEVLRNIHLCYVGDFMSRSSRVADEVLRETIGKNHPLREALEFLVRRMQRVAVAVSGAAAVGSSSSSGSISGSAGRHLWQEAHLDVRQRVSHAIHCSDVRPIAAHSPHFRLFRSHAKLSDERRERETVRETLDRHTRESRLIPFIRYITTSERMRTDATAQALLGNSNAPAHAHHQLHFTQRCLIEEVLMVHLNRLRMNTYENIELRNWSDRIKALLPLTQLLTVDAQRACPYRTLGLLADLVHTLGEYQAQLAQFQTSHSSRVNDDNLFSGIARISAWVASRGGTGTATEDPTDTMPPMFRALVRAINSTVAAHALPVHAYAGSQPAFAHRQAFSL